MSQVVRLQLVHEYQSQSNPYLPDIEASLGQLKEKGSLVERGWDRANSPGVIRHETGPEVIVLITALAELTVAIISLVSITKKHHPETVVNITVTTPDDLRRALDAVGNQK